MSNKKYILYLTLFITFLIFLDAKPLPKVLPTSNKKTIKANPKKNSQEHSKEYYDDLVRKGRRLDNITQTHKFYKKMNYTEETKRRRDILNNYKKKENKRKLSSSSQSLENVGFVDLIQKYVYSKSLYAMKYIMNNIQKYSTKFILYPYPFEYKEKNKELEGKKKSETGGVFTLDQTSLKSGSFSYLKNISNVEIGKAKGIYDIDIAILSIFYDNDGKPTDLFTESTSFCEYFTSTINKISTCIDGKNNYLEYKLHYPNKGAIVRISDVDLMNNTLFDENDQLKFKLLIIPDYMVGTEILILNEYLKPESHLIINKFRDLGGHILTSGKSGYLLELMNILPSNTYDTSMTILTKSDDGTTPVYPFYQCGESQEDFLKQLICLGHKNRTYLTQAFKMSNIPYNFDSLIKYTNHELSLAYKRQGYQYDINDESVTYDYILVSKEDQGKGRIFLVNGNPVRNLEYFDNIRNIILYSMSKNIIYDLNIKFTTGNKEIDESEEGVPIPAGEEGVQLLTNFKFYNLFNTPITDIKLDLLLVNKVVLKTIPNICEEKYDDKYSELNINYINKSMYLSCEINSLEELSSKSDSFKIEITDFTVTQNLIDIALIYSSFSYTHEGKTEFLTPGIYFAQGQAAALLRGTINKDPTSLYPILGSGLYFDLVLNVENKENSIAKEVKYISLVPLVSPLYDGKDEGSVARVVPLYEKYYTDHNYTYPWVSIINREKDYIDYIEVAGKNMCYVNDYDTPVKINVVERRKIEDKDKYSISEPTEKKQIDEYAGTNKGISANSLLRQLYFGDNQRFYETAAPRVSLFVDTAQEEGAYALYGNDIPDEFLDPERPNRAKAQYCFIRLDTYFYGSIFDQYQLPEGLDDSFIISLDKFNQEGKGKEDKIFGAIKSRVYNKGHYNSTYEQYNRLKPNEYFNPLLLYKNKTRLDPTNTNDMEKIKQLTNSKVKLTHFMIPFKDKFITSAGSLYGFKKTKGNNGYLEQYPSVKFIYAHSIELILAPNITRLGGCAEVILPSGVKFENNEDPVENDRITTSADNVAFFKNEYIESENKIKLYFRRGLMPNENYGLPSKCKAFIENLDSDTDLDITLNIYELKYDFSSTTLENYKKVETKTLKATFSPFFSLPCLEMETRLLRQSEFMQEPSTEMFEYELVNPFSRFGGYFQELTKHTTVYGSGEAHHRTDPGFQGISGGFSLISNIGTSSVPFAEFLEHELLAVPGVTSTSRLEWKDVWGRFWAQNLRSVYPDIPPIPPGPRNFIMTTTYELITDTENPEDQKRVIEWTSDEKVYIRIQMKMRNTYELYWEPTICHENQFPFMRESSTFQGNPLFVESQYDKESSSLGSDYDINLGFSPVYGVCYNEESYIGGQRITSDILNEMKNMMMCSADEDPIKMTECSLRSEELNLPLVRSRPDTINDTTDPTPDANWNYSPLIKAYLPDGYINTNKMWQLTVDGYTDDSFFKGYPYHLDDCIPNFDNSNTKPHDIIAFPIFKGLGYNVTYNSTYSINKFKEYSGWWSDQLQNKDHSLLAGQQKVSQVSVGHESLLNDDDWIDGKDIKQKDGSTSNIIKSRLKNLYVCMFNRHRVKITPGQTKYAFLKNVYQNNVIPILPDLEENDKRYKEYECDGTYQYDIYNISQVDNRVNTGNDRDWLYFAAGLRGNAMEDINVILKLEPIESTKFEGITKVQDGGRFTYWQPPDGPNSYQYFDCNVNTVISKRVDLTIDHRMFPTSYNTFNSYSYELFDISDKKEKNREYTMTTYMNSHGFGDATTTVYVGGTDATSCRVEPGEMTYVKIVFYNNAGFDWKMKDEGIALNDTAYQVYLNAMAILESKVTAVQYPAEYRFMSYEIPEEIKDYVTLTPSQHVMDISPQFFDLTFNNIKTIKDALEGDYYYCLNVSENFPDELRGKFWEIKMTLNEDMFEALPPNINDPTGIHDYHITIPSIRFGVPIKDGPNKGKIFYNLGQAENMVYTFKLYREFEIKDIKIVDDDIINNLGIAVSDDKNKFDNLMKLYEEIPPNREITDKIKISVSPDTKDSFYNIFTINLTEAFPLFPYELQPNLPYVSDIHLLIQSYSPYVPYGKSNLLKNTKIVFSDGRKEKDNEPYPNYISCTAAGPSYSPSLEYQVVNGETFENDDNVHIDFYNGDEETIKMTVTAFNEGTETAYNTNITIGIDPNVEYIPKEQSTAAIQVFDNGVNENDERELSITYNGKVQAGDEIKFDLFFDISFGDDSESMIRNLEASEEKKASLVKGMGITLCLADVKCVEGDSNYGKQSPNVNLDIPYKVITRAVGQIELQVENIGTNLVPKYVLRAIITNIENDKYNINDVEYSFKRKIIGYDDRYKQLGKNTKNNTYVDQPFKEGEIDERGNYTIYYKVIGEFPDGRTLDSTNKNEFMDSYKIVNEDKGFPTYAIIIVAVLGAAIVIGTGIVLYKLLSAKSALGGVDIAPTGVENTFKVSKFEKIDNLSSNASGIRPKRSIRNKSNNLSVSNNNNN